MNTPAQVPWTRLTPLFLALAVVGWGAVIILREPVTPWFARSATVWMALLLASSIWYLRNSFASLVAVALCAVVVGRLFSTAQIAAVAHATGADATDLLLQVETGPGVRGFGYLVAALVALLVFEFVAQAAGSIRSNNNAETSTSQDWILSFIRIYVGLMFVPHFVGHLFAGPHQFGIYTQYFAGLGMPHPAAQLVLAGTVEVVASVGLAFGLLTRPIALLAGMYLFLTMLLGGHFGIGYVWILPNGGYEFGIFWAVMSAVFVMQGGGGASIDSLVRRSTFFNEHPRLHYARFLFS